MPGAFADTRRRWLVACLALAAFVVAPRADAASTARADHVVLSIALEQALSPGRTAWIAIRQVIDPGWHTYWRNPGDTGLPTSFAWSLPRGVSAGEPLWPVPERIVTGPVVDYGYRGDATLLVPIAAGPRAALAGMRAKAGITLLECAQMCIPEHVSLDIGLGAPSGSPQLFARARASMPRVFDGQAQYALDPHALTLTIASAILEGARAGALRFFPATQNAVDDDATPTLQLAGDTLRWRLARSPSPRPFDRFNGVLEVAGRGALAISAVRLAPQPPESGTSGAPGLLGAIVFAFLGGLILNLMPCVLPILSMKFLALARSHEGWREIRRDGGMYFAGVLATFCLMGSTLIALKSGGAALGWGFQLQSPFVVLALALLMGAIGLNLLGVFELPLALAGVGHTLTRRQDGFGAFFTGALAVIVASPCTAPFMGAALAFAVTQTAPAAMLIFLSLGVGFAIPFTALSLLPERWRFVPRPGPWMIRFREFLAFPMFATGIWLLWVLAEQVGPDGTAMALALGLGVVFVAWLLPQLKPALRWPAAAASAALLIVLATGIGAAPSRGGGPDGWRSWSPQAVEEARLSGRPVFVDFSAAWCVTCLVNERVALGDPAVLERFARDGVIMLKADWTSRSAAIAGELGHYGRNGVPLYLLYPSAPGATPQVLPQILTPGTVLTALQTTEAGRLGAAGRGNRSAARELW